MRHQNDFSTVRLVGGTTLVGCALALLWALVIANPVYVSKAEILVQPAAVPAFEQTSRGAGVNPGHERELVHSGEVAELVRRELGTTATVAQLRSRVGVSVVGGTRMLDLTFRAPTRVEAKRGAEAYADAYLELKRRQVETIRAQRQESIEEVGADVVGGVLSNARTPGPI